MLMIKAIMGLCSFLPNVRIPVYILVILFGMGSWVAINSLWVELPILVDQSPEGWDLPSYLTVIIQIANIGPLLYMLVNKLAPQKFNEKHGVFSIVTIGAVASLLLVFIWKRTSYIDGVKHSTGLLSAVFLLSLVDCTSSVVFLPYMSRFRPQYISALFIGEGLSGLVPSLVALAQGVGKTECVNKTIIVNHTINETKLYQEYQQPRFPVEDFFYFLLSIILVCGLAFTLLHYLQYCKNEQVFPGDKTREVKFINADSASYKFQEFHNNRLENEEDTSDSFCSISTTGSTVSMSKTKLFYFLIITAIINALTNGVLPSIQSYACIPYGSQAYHLAATLGNIASPLTCFVVFLVPVTSASILSATAMLGFALSAYILALASQSPDPLLVAETSGAVLVVLAYVLLAVFMTFTKVSIATSLQQCGRQALLLCGIFIQVGSAIGAIVMFVMVNQLKLFTSKQACT